MVGAANGPNSEPRVASEAAGEAAGSSEESATTADTPPRRSRWLGGPTILLFERQVEGEIGDTGYQLIVDEIQGVLGSTGQVSQLGRSFSWAVSFGGPPWRDLGVAVSVRGGYTRIGVRENLLQLLIPIAGFGAASAAIGVNPVVTVARNALDLQWAGWAMPLMWIVAILAAARITYQYIAKRRARQLEALADRLVTLARRLVLERPARSNRVEPLQP
jgi:hypothetical protein